MSDSPADILSATRSYERWLGCRLKLIPADLRRKHAKMAEDPFTFLRATFYRWAQLWPGECPDEARAPRCLAVGDLHADNFGLWRDAEGRLVWGVNDFDEAAVLPYTTDLIRLATSVELARETSELELSLSEACAQLLAGYVNSLAAGGRPIVLTEKHGWLREIAASEAKDAKAYWRKLLETPRWRGATSAAARRALTQTFPAGAKVEEVIHRIAGAGSLGRERIAWIGHWRGGLVAREVKALTVSATEWAREEASAQAAIRAKAATNSAARRAKTDEIHYATLLLRAVRCPDPMVRPGDGCVVRRLAPDSSRIELSALPRKSEEARMLYEMGWETANLHLATPRAVTAIRRDLKRRGGDWLEHASRTMVAATIEDWRVWCARGR